MKRFLLRIAVALVLGLSLFVLLALAPVEGRRGSGIEQGVIRFRVLAASDRPGDQALKLKVRDAVLELLKPELERARDEREAAAAIERALPEIRRVAEETVRKQGIQLPVEVSWGVTEFPTKAYGPVIFPAGRYLALKIVIGRGEGRNWWCVLFPPLCYVDLTRAAGSASGRAGEPLWDGDSVYLVGRGCREVKGPLLRTKIGELLSGGRRPFLSWAWRRES